MPALVAMFGLSIKFLMAYFITRLLLALGLSYVVYQGMDTLIGSMETEIQTQFGSLGLGLYDILAMMGADVAISILFSAISIRLLMVGFSGGVKAGFRMKVPGM